MIINPNPNPKSKSNTSLRNTSLRNTSLRNTRKYKTHNSNNSLHLSQIIDGPKKYFLIKYNGFIRKKKI